MKIESRLAKLETEAKTLFIKVDKMDKLTETIATLVTDVRVLAEQIKQQNDMFQMIINKYDDRLKIQGERIGETPTQAEFKELSDRVNELEKKPTRRLETISMKVLGYVAVAIIAYFAYRTFGI